MAEENDLTELRQSQSLMYKNRYNIKVNPNIGSHPMAISRVNDVTSPLFGQRNMPKSEDTMNRKNSKHLLGSHAEIHDKSEAPLKQFKYFEQRQKSNNIKLREQRTRHNNGKIRGNNAINVDCKSFMYKKEMIGREGLEQMKQDHIPTKRQFATAFTPSVSNNNPN